MSVLWPVEVDRVNGRKPFYSSSLPAKSKKQTRISKTGFGCLCCLVTFCRASIRRTQRQPSIAGDKQSRPHCIVLIYYMAAWCTLTQLKPVHLRASRDTYHRCTPKPTAKENTPRNHAKETPRGQTAETRELLQAASRSMPACVAATCWKNPRKS